MKISKTSFYTTIFVIVLFLQLYLPSFKINVIIQIFVLGIYFFFEKKVITKSFLKTISPIIVLFLLGFLGLFFHKYAMFNVIKDIFHFTKPLLGVLIGYFFYKQINDFKSFVKTIVLLGLISAIIHFCLVFIFSEMGTVSDIRELGRDNFLELFSLFFIAFYKKFQGENLFKNKANHSIIFYALLFSCVLYFSRTMIVAAVILLISIYGYSKITKKTLKIIGMLLLSVSIFYMYLFSVKLDRNGNSIESFLYKVKIAPEEIFETKIDRENHKDLWDHWRGYEAKRALALMKDNPSSFVIGMGYGSLVNLKFFAPLTENYNDKGLKYISELHNGFPYILYKTGLFGVIVYLVFLLKLYRNIYTSSSFISVFISAIGLVYFFTTLTITGIYNAKDVIVFILGALLFFKDHNQK